MNTNNSKNIKVKVTLTLEQINDVLACIGYAEEQIHDSYIPVLNSIPVEPMNEYTDDEVSLAIDKLKAICKAINEAM